MEDLGRKCRDGSQEDSEQIGAGGGIGEEQEQEASPLSAAVSQTCNLCEKKSNLTKRTTWSVDRAKQPNLQRSGKNLCIKHV